MSSYSWKSSALSHWARFSSPTRYSSRFCKSFRLCGGVTGMSITGPKSRFLEEFIYYLATQPREFEWDMICWASEVRHESYHDVTTSQLVTTTRLAANFGMQKCLLACWSLADSTWCLYAGLCMVSPSIVLHSESVGVIQEQRKPQILLAPWASCWHAHFLLQIIH